MEFIGDHRGLFLVLGLLGLIASVGYIYLNLGKQAPASEPRRTTRPIPTARPSQQRTPSLEAGQAEHALRGQAKTVKVEPPVKDQRNTTTQLVAAKTAQPDDDDARDSLFGGLGSDSEDDTKRKVDRLSELSLHQTVEKTAVVADPHAAPLPGETPALPAANRSQTAELDDILSRIDKVLAENPVMASSTITPESATPEQKARAAESTVASDSAAKTDKPGQQQLF
jgi:hypothetical protein